MANIPSPQSFEQLLSDMLKAYATKLGIDDFNIGSANTSFFEVVALANARTSGDIFQVLRDFSVNRATGDALKRLAQEYNVTPLSAKPTVGNVNIIDTNFVKIFTKVYPGANPPNIGSTQIKVGDASQFTPTGSIYIGRGTPNVEGPLPYTVPPVQTGSYWTITLSGPTAKFHNIEESVILAQGGNRSIAVNTAVLSPGVGSSADIQFNVVTAAVILDGEVEVDNVQVTSLLPGATGNVPAGAVKRFVSVPFAGATVTNPLPFTTGAASETDEQLRIRIKRALASQGLGTATAIKALLIGATPSDENSTIVSDSLVLNTNGTATVYIDDGTGYEEKSTGVGLESIVDSALGGENFFQLQTGGRQAPVAKAFLQTILEAPFDLIGGDTLAVTVGRITYQHVFQTSDFLSPGNATAFEVTASINADATLGFEALTSGNASFIDIRAKAEVDDNINVTTPTTAGRDAAIQLGFTSNTVETLRLYKNDILLTKDGLTASVFTQAQAFWSFTIQNGDTLILSIDDTAPITFTINDSDFIDTGLYPSVSATNSLASWVQVFNNKLTGVTATIVGNQIELTSNLNANSRAVITIDPASTLVTKGMFSSLLGLSSFGKTSDFTLDRNTAQFELTTPLLLGDKLAAGSTNTEAFIKSAKISSGSITLLSDAHIWLSIDTPGQIIKTGVTANSLLTISTPFANTIRYTSNITNAFSNVQLGDYIIVWSDELTSGNRIEGRVHAVTLTTLDVLITPAEYALVVPTVNVVFSKGFVVLRSKLAPQKFRVQTGTKTLDQIAQELQAQTENLIFSVFQEQYLYITTTTMDDTKGSLLVVTSDTQGLLLLIADDSFSTSQDSLIAFRDSQGYTGELPLFIHTAFASGTTANPINSFITSVVSSISLAGRDPNELICVLHPYGASNDAQPYGECVQETSISGATIGVAKDPYLRRIRTADRFFIGSPLDFGSEDTAVVVLDNNVVNDSFEIPIYRKALTNTGIVSNPFNFNAYDVDSGPTTNFSSNFGTLFDFSNFKVLMQAKKVLKPTPPQTAILYRATKWGRSGEKINVGYSYPTAPNAPMGSTVKVDTAVSIRISLASGVLSPTSITSTTQWNITITPNTPSAGIDQVTYTWNTVGTNPGLTLSGGEYVNITTDTSFNTANTGTFRVSTQVGFTPTATSFTVQRPTGVAVTESNRPTTVNGAITFYVPTPVTAAQVVAYVNANLSQYISATLVNDGGTSGSGVIVLSTFENSNFTFDSVQLLDGINWLASSNLGGSPQFIFKKALSLPTDVGYAFNNGEEIRFIPTTMPQVKHLISILAVTGFTTLGNVALVERAAKLELSTKILGGLGAIQIVGGLANQYQVPILDSALILNNTFSEVSVDSVASKGVHSDQWFRLQASLAQKKIAGLAANTSVTIIGNSPIAAQSTIKLLGRTLTQRYFGKPRNHLRTKGRTFRVEKQGSLVCISWAGAGISETDPVFVKSLLNFNDSSGGTFTVAPVIGDPNDATYTIVTGSANFTELSIGDFIVISGLATTSNNGTFLVTGVSNNGKVIQVFNPHAQVESGSFIAGNFSASSGVSEGDTIILTSPFAALNQGRFRVIREYNNSIWIENPNVIEEEVFLPYNAVNLAFDSTTVFKVNASNNTFLLEWTGTGTEPQLGNATMGDALTVGNNFASGNNTTVMVLRSSVKLQHISKITVPSGSAFTLGGAGKYFEINNAGDVNKYYVWYNVNSTNSDPGPIVGRTGVEVDILNGDTATLVASKTATAINGFTVGLTAVVLNDSLTVTTTGFIETTDPINVNVPSPFTIQIIQEGTRTFLEAINPSAVTEASVMVSGIGNGVLLNHRPQMQFWEYDATVIGDLFVSTGNVLNILNAGSHTIAQVLDRDTAIVTGSLANITNVSLNGNVTAVYIQEGVLYSGYKHVLLSSAEPGTLTRNLLIFDSSAQYEKINEAASVQMTSLNKLDFDTAIKNGLDSYRYNTGLIAEANRIIYGDPRDASTYPGVGAAGPDIFTRAPLTLRIQVSIDVRLLTGAPFNSIAQQVRSNVSSLINANPIGQSIDISSIVSIVRSIPGVQSVAINSPQYDATHDLILVAPNEKARIINPIPDIIVNQIGS